MKTIAVGSSGLGSLPTITRPVGINGYSQPGASSDSKAVGSDAVLMIELDGAGVPDGDGFVIEASNSTVKGLVVNRWKNTGIRINGSGATGNRIVGNYIVRLLDEEDDKAGAEHYGHGTWWQHLGVLHA